MYLPDKDLLHCMQNAELEWNECIGIGWAKPMEMETWHGKDRGKVKCMNQCISQNRPLETRAAAGQEKGMKVIATYAWMLKHAIWFVSELGVCANFGFRITYFLLHILYFWF